MASQARTFIYSEAQIQALERTISPKRFSSYVLAAAGDKSLAVLLYERNTSLSESLYGVLQGVEISVRNSANSVLSAGFGGADRSDRAPLRAPEQEAIFRARRELDIDGKYETPGRIVAELAFGFWTALTDKRYARSLWVPYLYKAFPYRRMSHKTAHARLEAIRKAAQPRCPPRADYIPEPRSGLLRYRRDHTLDLSGYCSLGFKRPVACSRN